MIIDDCFKVRNLILSTVLSLGVGFISPAFAQQRLEHSYLIDTNNKTWTRLDLGIGRRASALNDFGQVTSSGKAINNAGQMAGIGSYDGYIPRVYITGPDGVGQKLLSYVGVFSQLGDINDAGQVVGSNVDRVDARAFMTGPNGEGMTDIGDLGGESPYHDFLAYATGINETGQS